MAAKAETLARLHELQAQMMIRRLEADLNDDVYTDAATLGAISKFLKDNEITADPANSDDLTEMRQKLIAAQQARRERAANVIQLVEKDLKEA